jgi:hypothetical protein
MRIKTLQLILVGMVVLALAVTGYAQVRRDLPGIATMVRDGGGLAMTAGEFTQGSDGTIYILTHVAASSTGNAMTTLRAYNGTTGASIWSLTFDGGNLSKPVLGPDGRLFLVADGHLAIRTIRTISAAEDAQLFIVSAKGVLLNTVTLPGETASAPVVFGTGTSYYVYVTVMNVTLDASGMPQREIALYAYDQGGNQKFSITLDQ